MDPVSIAVISIGSTIIGGITSFIGQQQQAEAASAAANYQSQVAKNNQIIAQQNADYSRQAGVAEVEAQGMKTRAIVGAEIAGQGASGLDPTIGSPTDVVRGTRDVGRLDALNIMRNAELRARGYDIQGTNFGAEAGLAQMKAQSAQSAGLVGGFSSLLGGASSFGEKWLKFQDQGVFGGTSSGGTGDLF